VYHNNTKRLSVRIFSSDPVTLNRLRHDWDPLCDDKRWRAWNSVEHRVRNESWTINKLIHTEYTFLYPYRHWTPVWIVGRREGCIRISPGWEKFRTLFYLRHVSFPTFPASAFSTAAAPPFYQSLSTRATATAIIYHRSASEESSYFVSTVLQWLQHTRRETPLESKTFSSGRWVTIHHCTTVLFVTRDRNIFIRSHTLHSSPPHTIRLSLLIVLLLV